MMAENEHAIKLAALAVVGTVGVCTAIATQWVIPTVTSSLSYEVATLKERLVATEKKTGELKETIDRSTAATKDDESKARERIAGLIKENQKLKNELFTSLKANAFQSGNPYPVGFDKLKVGDRIDKVFDLYSQEEKSSTLRSIYIRLPSDVFRGVRVRHSSSKRSEGMIDSIGFETRTIDRILDASLPRMPKDWLENNLRKALGVHFVIGPENDCLMWKTNEGEVVYYPKDADWFEVSGYSSYPAGCSVTDDQSSVIRSGAK